MVLLLFGEVGDMTSSPLCCNFSISRAIDLASSAVKDLCIEGDVMGEVGLCGGCEMDLSKLDELACRDVEGGLVEEHEELDRTLCRFV
jgi:hypothetical protein